MSFKAQEWVYGLRDPISPTQKAVLAYLAFRADDAGRAWPSVARIAADTGMGERTVQTAIRALVETGLLDFWARKNRTNVYHLSIPETHVDIDYQFSAPGFEEGAYQGERLASIDGVQFTAEVGADYDVSGCRSRAQTDSNKQITKKDSSIVEFEEFWRSYPFRVNSSGVKSKNGKQPALRHYVQARKKVSHSELMAALSKYIIATDPKYVMDAERWLRKAYWTNEFVEAKQPEKDPLFGMARF
jgi:hypothetical protein